MTPGTSRTPLFEELSRVYPELTTPQKRVADYLLRHPEKVRDAAVTTVCRATGTTEPVIFAVCRAVGRRGYRQLKLDLAEEMAVLQASRRAAGRATEVPGPDVNLDGGESPRDVARKVGAAYLESVEAAVTRLDPAAFESAVAALCSARRVVVFGMGVSGHVAEMGQYALLRAGLSVTGSNDSYVQLIHLAALGRGDAALAVSYMGEQPELTEGLELARRRGATTIALTGNRGSAMAAQADLILELPPRRSLSSYVSLGARIAAAELYVIDALAAAVAISRRAEFDERAAAVHEVIEARKARGNQARAARNGRAAGSEEKQP
ncbi:MAG TPA: MurR/RpiR family transcriptional regulator [Planctomycetota bacterium]|nr:MurR/RpiR family transcriptional regulator [Planctomycetota bacterium]